MPFSADLPDGAFDVERLQSHVGELREEFFSLAPWPHLIIDDFLPVSFAKRASTLFPPISRMKSRLAGLLGARSYSDSLASCDVVLSSIFSALHDSRFNAFLDQLTGIEGLQPDREMVGAGFHHGARGSYLRVHADHNTHPSDPTLFRRVNVMLYLNEEWNSRWNGDLELWDREAKRCQKRIAPKFNRCVIMYVDDTAYHGYGPLRTPKALTRKALASYYYAKRPAAHQSASPHSTLLPTLKNEALAFAVLEKARRAALFHVEKALRSVNHN